MLKRSLLSSLLLLMAGTFQSAQSATFTVSKDGRGAFSTVQAAVDKAGKGDIVEIMDAAVYAEQVTIDSTKSGLTLRSANPTSLAKPTIIYKDLTHQGPKSCLDALVPAKIDFDQNGALRLLRVRNITIDGITVNGGGAAPFSWLDVWGDGVSCTAGTRYPLFHGNSAIVLFVSGGVTIRNCNIASGFFGIYIKDRNEGGVYANVNPGDVEKSNVVPLSGFGKTGSHVFENNRIHNNAWAFFFESSWDLGSTIRYNLIFENHHATTAIATAVKAMPDGDKQAGGAFQFKDVMLSPLSIYNNTLWHNFHNFTAGYRPGAQHLIFNNIFAQPFVYWDSYDVMKSAEFMVIDPAFVNRMHNSIYAAQIQTPAVQTQNVNAQQYDTTTQKQVVKDSLVKYFNSVRIMNQMGNVATAPFDVNITLPMSTGPVIKTSTITNAALPGALIVGTGKMAFPASANVRWFEINFKSTDTASADFLSPDWDDPVVAKYVTNAGWPEAGIYNSDGKVADLGAIPSVARPKEDVRIQPLAPVIISGTSATLSFSLTGLNGELTSPHIKYIKLVRNLPLLSKGFGYVDSLSLLTINNATPSTAALKMGGNTITATFSGAFPADEKYAFFEIIVEGTNADGQLVSTNVGFLPYRTLDNKFLVEIFNAAGKKVDSVKVGEPVKLRVTPLTLAGAAFTGTINPAEVRLSSGSDLLTTATPATVFTLTSLTGITEKDVMFTKIPQGGLDWVTAAGISKAGSTLVFYGVSDAIKILPADPEKVVFQDPPSKILIPGVPPTTIDPGQSYAVKVEVRDRFDNPVSGAVSVTIKSNNPTIGDIDGPTTVTTDASGIALFHAKVTLGDKGEIFELEASIPGKTPDKADMKVGQPRDRLWVIYSDLATYNEAVELRGTAGDFLPITIRAGKDANTKLVDRVTEVKLEVTAGLAIYGAPTDPAAKYTFTLVGGEAVVYVKGLKMVDNGFITVSPVSDNTILPGNRGKVYFTFTPRGILSASLHADNGFGRADRLEIHFKEALKAIPDSINLSWPSKGPATQVIRTGIVLDPVDPKHVTVKLTTPFAPGITASPTATAPGTAYTYDPATPEIPVQAMDFLAADSIGPLLDSAMVQDRVDPADDTLFISFSEAIVPAGLNGASLILIKKGGSAPVVLTVLTSASLAKGGYRLAVSDLGPGAPKEGDSLMINAAGPITDAFGNHAHALNRPVVLRLKIVPRPPVVLVKMDKPFLKVDAPAQRPDFVIYAPNPDSTWTPIQFSGYTHKNGTTTACNANCGAPLRGDFEGSIDRPGLTVETNRAMKYSATIFTNLGAFVNGFSGEITNANLGLDDRGIPIAGAPAILGKNSHGNFQFKITWNAQAFDGARAATGAYLVRISLNSKTEDSEGKSIPLNSSRTIRFGMIRK